MAYAKLGLLGEFKGRLGNTVIYEVYGKTRIRLKPSVKPPPATGAKKQAQEDFKRVMGIMQATKAFVRIGFFDEAEGRSAFHEGLSHNLKRLRESEDKNEANWLQLSTGKRASALEVSMEIEGKQCTIRWGQPEADKPWSDQDTVMLLALNTASLAATMATKAQRGNHQAAIQLPPAGSGEEVLVFVAFRKQYPTKKQLINMSVSQVVK